MNINGYGKYKVIYNEHYDYIKEYDYDINSYTYDKGKIYWRSTENGGKLLDLIGTLVSNSECIEVVSKDDYIYISHFNPNNGTGRDIKITYKEVHKKEVQNNASQKS